MPNTTGSLDLPTVGGSGVDKEKAKRHRLLWKYKVKKPVTDVAISTFGNKVVIGCEDNYLYFFDKKEELLWDFNCGTTVRCVGINAMGSHIVAGTDQEVILLNQKGEVVWREKVISKINRVLITDTADLIVAGCQAKRIYFFDKEGNILRKQRTEAEVTHLKKTDDDSLIVASSEATIMLFDRTANPLWHYKTKWDIQALTISGMGEIILAGAMMSLYCINNKSDLLWKTTGKSVADVLEVSRSKDYIIRGGRDGILTCYNVMGDIIWQYKTGSVKATAERLVTKGVTTVKLNNTGQYIAAGSVNEKVYFLSRDMELIYRLECEDEVRKIAMSKVGLNMAVIADETLYFVENTGLFPLLFEDVAKEMEGAVEHDLDMKKAQRYYLEAVSSYEKNAYPDSSKKLDEVRREILSQQRAAIKEILPNVTKRMSEAKLSEKGVARFQSMLERAKNIYKQGRYYTALEAFQNVLNELNRLERKAESRAPAVKESPEVKQAPAPAPATGAEVKRKATKSEEAAEARRVQEEERARVARAKALEEEKRAAESRALQEKVVEGLNRLTRRFSSLEDAGMNVASVRRNLSQGKEALEAGELKKALELSQAGNREADQLEKHMEEKTALDLLSDITDKITKARGMDIDTSDFERGMARGVKAFDKNLFRECVTIIRNLDEAVSEAILMASPEYRELDGRIAHFEEVAEEMRSSGVEVVEIEGILDKCRKNMGKDRDLVERMLEEAEGKIEETRDEHSAVLDKFKETQKRIERLEEQNYDMRSAQGVYHDGLIALYSGDKRKAQLNLQKAIELLEEIEEEADEEEVRAAEDDPVIASLKERNAQLEEKLERQGPELTKREQKIMELEIVIRDLEEKLREMEDAKPTMKECSECGASVPESNKFCGECGHEFERHCPECGTKVPKNFRFCGKCGNKMS